MNDIEKREENPWVSLMDESPPHDTLVETKGGGRHPDEIWKDYIHSTIGDWMRQPGDPTHWRHIVKKVQKTD